LTMAETKHLMDDLKEVWYERATSSAATLTVTHAAVANQRHVLIAAVWRSSGAVTVQIKVGTTVIFDDTTVANQLGYWPPDSMPDDYRVPCGENQAVSIELGSGTNSANLYGRTEVLQ